jgi:hypothetical protein
MIKKENEFVAMYVCVRSNVKNEEVEVKDY